MNEKEASQFLREIVLALPDQDFGTHARHGAALAYLDVLERNWLDTKAQRDEDDHPSLVKIISLDGLDRSARITFGSQGVRNVTAATITVDATRRAPAHLHTTSLDEKLLASARRAGGNVPIVHDMIELGSFVFRGVRL
jgi:hypothetical protein